MNRMVKHSCEEKGMTFNEGRIFTCFYDGDENILPNEILFKIFQYLSFTDLRQCALVSKGWRVLSLCPILWKKVHLHEASLDIPFLERLINCGVQQLHVRYSEIYVNSQPLPTRYFGSSKFETLQYLKMESTDIDMNLLEVIMLMVPKLKCFIFESDYYSEIFNANIFSALLHLEFLEKLHLFSVNLYFPDIMHILDKIGAVMNLQSLKLSFTLEGYNTTVNVTNFVEKCLSIFPNLQYVGLGKISLLYIDDKIFKILAQLKRLTTLKIDKTRVSSEVMKALNQKKSFVHLKELRIRCKKMEEESLALLLRTSLNIEVLSLYNMFLTNAVLKALLSLNNLKKLDMFLDYPPPPAIFQHGDELQNFDSKLSSFCLWQTSGNFANLSKMLSLFKYLDSLTVRRLSFDKAALIEILKMKNLKKLDIQNCLSSSRLEISSLREITVELHELKELRVWCNRPNPNFPIECILSGTSNLKFLEVRNYTLTKEFVLCVSSLKTLEELKCELCWEKMNTGCDFWVLDALYLLDNLITVYVSYRDCGWYPCWLENLLSMCRKVKSLHLYGINVTKNLIDIIKTMKELEYFEMAYIEMGHRKIIVDWVTEMLNYCPNLTEDRVKIKMLKKTAIP